MCVYDKYFIDPVTVLVDVVKSRDKNMKVNKRVISISIYLYIK